jgi:hypothetical protein
VLACGRRVAGGGSASQRREWNPAVHAVRRRCRLPLAPRPLLARLQPGVDSPLVLVIDDLQWCDAPSNRALAFIARRPDGLPVTLIVASRPLDPVAHPDAARARRVPIGHRGSIHTRPDDRVKHPLSWSQPGDPAARLRRGYVTTLGQSVQRCPRWEATRGVTSGSGAAESAAPLPWSAEMVATVLSASAVGS